MLIAQPQLLPQQLDLVVALLKLCVAGLACIRTNSTMHSNHNNTPPLCSRGVDWIGGGGSPCALLQHFPVWFLQGTYRVAMVPWSHGSMAQWYHGTIAMLTWSHPAVVNVIMGYHAIMAPSYHVSALAPYCAPQRKYLINSKKAKRYQ